MIVSRSVTGIEPGLQEPESVIVTTVPNEISLSFARFLQYFNTAVPGDPGDRSHSELQGITNIRVLEYSCMSWLLNSAIIVNTRVHTLVLLVPDIS